MNQVPVNTIVVDEASQIEIGLWSLSHLMFSKLTSFSGDYIPGTAFFHPLCLYCIPQTLAAFDRFQKTLRKMCFIGDDKQCKLELSSRITYIVFFSAAIWPGGPSRSPKHLRNHPPSKTLSILGHPMYFSRLPPHWLVL